MRREEMIGAPVPSRMIPQMVLLVVLFLAPIAPNQSAHAGSINTAGIITKTISAIPACLDWRPIGICFWLRCSLYECSVEASIKVRHNMADLVVAVYNDLENHPISDIGAVLAPAQQGAVKAAVSAMSGGLLDQIGSQGGRTEDGVTIDAGEVYDRRNLFFREADAIGNPTSLFQYNISGSIPLICPASATKPLFPHYQSSFDALVWRDFVPTEWIYPATWLPGLREIGSFSFLKPRWGSVHPRIGFIVHATEPKAAAVLAQRAGDIVTRGGQPHVYIATNQDQYVYQDGYRITMPPPLLENDASTGSWQMLLPVTEDQCSVFAEENDLASIPGWAGGKVSADGDYVWNLWRPYECCQVQGIPLFDINF